MKTKESGSPRHMLFICRNKTVLAKERGSKRNGTITKRKCYPAFDGRYLKNEGIQRHSVDFRHRVRSEGVVVRLSIQAVTNSGTRATGTTFPLLGAGSADPELLQALHLSFGIETHFLYLSYNRLNDTTRSHGRRSITLKDD